MTIAVLIEPVDLLFCRDGRPIVPGAGAAAGSNLPNPQVLAGAIRTAVLRQRGDLPADGNPPGDPQLKSILTIQVRGPLLADLGTGMPYIPMPADVLGDKAKHGLEGRPRARLAPRAGVPGWVAPGDAKQALALWPVGPAMVKQESSDKYRPGELATQNGWLDWQNFQQWAAGKVPTAAVPSGKLWHTETRTQVALDAATATAADGQLFTTRYLRLACGVGLYAEIDGADELPEQFVIGLGGDRRQARVRQVAPVSWPTGGSVALAMTPTILPVADGRCPAAWKAQCRGLAIPGADPISGWDLAKAAPRPTRWAIRPGAVWHLAQPLSAPPPCIGIDDETRSGFGWMAYGAAPAT